MDANRRTWVVQNLETRGNAAKGREFPSEPLKQLLTELSHVLPRDLPFDLLAQL